MSIFVEQLSKNYGSQRALDGLSFEIKKGEVVGFLGPNGAGKTTCMKILTTALLPTSGRAAIAGFDLLSEPHEIRKKVGFLPEHNPLYDGLYIKEYLYFIAGLYKIKRPKIAVEKVVEWTGLHKEQQKKISAISKGYRQRLGLAQALIHDPEVLILDEPVSGLDPNQLVEVRKVIKDVGLEKTVLFSSHIMQEVEAICNRVVIINNGRKVADGDLDQLKLSGDAGMRIKLVSENKAKWDWVERVSGVADFEEVSETVCIVRTEEDADPRATLFKEAVSQGIILLEFTVLSRETQALFSRLTREGAGQ